MKKRALIFYIFSDGHFHAASAIEQGLEAIEQDIDIEKVNALSYTNPILEKIINKAYLRVIRKSPEVWGHIYDNPDVMRKTEKARETLHKLNTSKVKKLIESNSTDIIFCTQAFPCGMVADYKRTTGNKVFLVGVLTDHAPHSYWLHDEVDLYVVPSEETARTLEGKGIPSAKIKVYGIPVDPKFKEKHDVSKIKKELNFSTEDPVVLIMGGSQGLGAMEDAAKLFLNDSEHKYQLVVVAGSNKKLYTKLKKLSQKQDGGDIRILSFVENIDELMEAADLIITKAGGMTTAEALVKKLPIMIVDPIPGHERMNTDYLVKKGVAIEVKDPSQIHEKINELFGSKGKLESMRKNAEALSRPDSALKIARLSFKG